MRPIDERRAQQKRYKEDVEREGKPFYPFAMFHDTVMSLIVVAVIIGLSVIWKVTVPGDAGEEGYGTEPGWIGPLYSEPADPGTTSFTPRPDWYFYFLFYLLRIFKWPESVILGTVGIPTILLVILIMLPFLDLRRERRLSRRPVAITALIVTAISMGVLTYKGATAKEALASEVVAEVPKWVAEQGLPPEAEPGARLFAGVGCVACHTYLGTGSSSLGAPDLTEVGARRQGGVDGFVAFLKNPPAPMIQFANLPDDDLRKIAIFLDASKGPKDE